MTLPRKLIVPAGLVLHEFKQKQAGCLQQLLLNGSLGVPR